MKNVRKETNATGKSGFGTSDRYEATNSVMCASEREASSIASITSIDSRNPGERTVPSSSGSGSVVAVVHETGERKSAMELEALVMVNHCFHP